MSEQPTSEKFFGKFRMVSATPIGKPTLNGARPGRKITLEAFDAATELQGVGDKRKRLDNGFHADGRPRKLRKLNPAPVPPPIRSIGVYDIGQGNCNILFNNLLEPLTYYDLGYPLWFFLNSVPAVMRVGNGAFMGPITDNTAGNLEVILSHWDYDHWRMGGYAAMNNIQWTVPVQPVGPTALAFWNSIPAHLRVIYPPGIPFQMDPNFVLLDCQPTPGMAPPAIMNNTGIAIWLETLLPTTDANRHTVLLTGDANCDSAYAIHPNFGAMTGLLAVHHGSNTHGAPNNLPAQAAAYNGQGRVFYSYGVSSVTGAHAYGFPNAAAVASYRAAGWGHVPPTVMECSTAEGNQINAGGLANRGNIRVGDNSALPAAYNYSAFSVIQHQVN